MRDLETIESALRIAETGHLTFGTLHTNSAAQTINRIVDVFPAHQQSQIRAQLSLVLEGIMCQSLLPKASGTGRCLAMEILVPNAAIRNLIREDKIHQIYSDHADGPGEVRHADVQPVAWPASTSRSRSPCRRPSASARTPDELQDMINRGAGLSTPQAGGRPPDASGGSSAASASRLGGSDACLRLERQDPRRQGGLRRARRPTTRKP